LPSFLGTLIQKQQVGWCRILWQWPLPSYNGAWKSHTWSR
jgi:hypothetical protein